MDVPTGWLVVLGVIATAAVYHGFVTKVPSLPVGMLTFVIMMTAGVQMVYSLHVKYDFVWACVFGFVAWAACASAVRHLLFGLRGNDDAPNDADPNETDTAESPT